MGATAVFLKKSSFCGLGKIFLDSPPPVFCHVLSTNYIPVTPVMHKRKLNWISMRVNEFQ